MSEPASAAPTFTTAELVTLVVLLAGGIVLCAVLVGRVMETRSPLGGILAPEPTPPVPDGTQRDDE